MYQPKRTKFRKFQKGRARGVVSNMDTLKFGKFGIKTLQAARIRSQTIEAIRRIITRKLKRTGVVWIRVFPDISVSSKPAEVRMGKGKGSPDFWACRVKKGQILFEIDGVTSTMAMQAVKAAKYKLPVSTKYISLS
uniref:Large ribosomal subunit protein uL16m n=1 Tax=Prototheca zopfii TaxID=3112 RepID=A0A2P1G7T2_9CHLO|nr:ribosomal protein L16 [Prototheca ciferrii]AVM80896.1 ribosomal protein L16 [Prototheca ciferrii]